MRFPSKFSTFQQHPHMLAYFTFIISISLFNSSLEAGAATYMDEPRLVRCRANDRSCLAGCQPDSVGRAFAAVVEAECDHEATTGVLTVQLVCRPRLYLPPLTNFTINQVTDTRAKMQWIYNWGDKTYPDDGGIHYNCSIDRQQELAELHGLNNSDRRVWRSGGTLAQVCCLRLTDLLPMQAYTCNLWAIRRNTRSWPIVARFVTKFGKPQLPVVNLNVSLNQLESNSTLQLTWGAGMNRNLNLSYRVTVNAPLNVTFVTQSSSINFTIDDAILEPYLGAYPEAGFIKVGVQPFNQMGDGPSNFLEVALPPYQSDVAFSESHSNSCQSGRQVHWFQVNRTVNDLGQVVCFHQQAYLQCQTE